MADRNSQFYELSALVQRQAELFESLADKEPSRDTVTVSREAYTILGVTTLHTNHTLASVARELAATNAALQGLWNAAYLSIGAAVKLGLLEPDLAQQMLDGAQNAAVINAKDAEYWGNLSEQVKAHADRVLAFWREDKYIDQDALPE